MNKKLKWIPQQFNSWEVRWHPPNGIRDPNRGRGEWRNAQHLSWERGERSWLDGGSLRRCQGPLCLFLFHQTYMDFKAASPKVHLNLCACRFPWENNSERKLRTIFITLLTPPNGVIKNTPPGILVKKEPCEWKQNWIYLTWWPEGSSTGDTLGGKHCR